MVSISGVCGAFVLRYTGQRRSDFVKMGAIREANEYDRQAQRKVMAPKQAAGKGGTAERLNNGA